MVPYVFREKNHSYYGSTYTYDMEGFIMEKFKTKNMTDAQVDEIVELMDGEHGETLELWRKENYEHGQGIGMVGGALCTVLIAILARGAVEMGKTAFALGKGFVTTVKNKVP